MLRPARRFLRCGLIAVLPAAGMLAAAAVGAGAETVAARPPVSATAAALAKSELAKLVIGDGRFGRPASAAGSAVRSARPAGVAFNWAGYADDGNSVSKVSASWTEPRAACVSGAEQLVAFWVGIDGNTSGSVEQDGTMIECYQGNAYQYTWWEMYPADNVQLVGQTLAGGEAITATVTRTGTAYTLTVADAGHPADSFIRKATCTSCANSSAEWIAEAPTSGSGVYPLTDFRSWQVSGARMAEGGVSGSVSSHPGEEITMIDSAEKVKARPGPLVSRGTGFSVTWQRAS